MWFYYLLLVLLNIGLGYVAGRYYLQRRDAKAAEQEITPIATEEPESEAPLESQASEPEPESEPPAVKEPVAEDPVEPTASDEPAETTSDEPLSPPTDTADPDDSAGSNDARLIGNRDVTRLIGDFREEMQRYRETLDTYNQQAIGYQTELESQAIRDSVQSLQTANETHATRQSELLGQLHGATDGSASLGAITGRVEQAVDQEKRVIEAVNIELELSAAETDAEKGSRQLLEQTAALLSASNDYGDRLDAILGELEQEETNAKPKQPSPKRAEPEAVS